MSVKQLDLQLIAAVEVHPELYNAENENYHNSVIKNEVWEDIAKQLNLRDYLAARKRWTSLRDRFRKSVLNFDPNIKKTRFKYFTEMQFLISHLSKPRRRLEFRDCGEDGEYFEDSNENVIAVDSDEDDIDSALDGKEEVIPKTIPAFFQTPSTSQKRAAESAFNGQNTPTPPTKICKLEVNEPSSSGLTPQSYIQPQQQSSFESNGSHDHMSSFLKFVEDTIRTFPPIMQVEIKSKISQLVSEFEMKHVTSENKN